MLAPAADVGHGRVVLVAQRSQDVGDERRVQQRRVDARDEDDLGASAELLEAGGDAVQRAEVLLGVRGDLDVLRERWQLLAGGANDDDRP